MNRKELLKYLTGVNDSLTEDEIGKRFSILRNKLVWDKLSDEVILKMAMCYRESDLPIHVVEILKEFGAKLLLEEMDLLEDFTKRRFIRLFEVFPNEGIRAIKDYFNEFNKNFSEAVTDISTKRKYEKLQNLKNVLDFLQTYPFNEIINLELNKHKPYIKDYINCIEVEFEKKNKVEQPIVEDSKITGEYNELGNDIKAIMGDKSTPYFALLFVYVERSKELRFGNNDEKRDFATKQGFNGDTFYNHYYTELRGNNLGERLIKLKKFKEKGGYELLQKYPKLEIEANKDLNQNTYTII